MEPIAFIGIILIAVFIPSTIFFIGINKISEKITKTDEYNIRTTIYRDERYTDINQQIYDTLKEHTDTMFAINDIFMKYCSQLDDTDKRRLNKHMMKLNKLDQDYHQKMTKLHEIQLKEDKTSRISE